MFTGIVSAVGTIVRAEPREKGLRLAIDAGPLDLRDVGIGDSIAINGVCLTVVAIDNQSSTYGWPGGIEQRFAVEGWSAAVCDGRDHDAIERALTTPHPGKPHVVVAHVEKDS